MKVKECMTLNVNLGRPQMTLREAAEKMLEGNFGILPIQENERLVGVVTDRDLAIRAMAKGMDPNINIVAEVMSRPILYCFENQDVDEVLLNLGKNQVRRLPVLNEKKLLVGILSLKDVALSGEDPLKVERAFCEISKASTKAPMIL